MKFTAAALLLASSTQAKGMPQDTKMDVVHVVEGVLMGALDAEFPDIEHCIQDGERVITDVEHAYKHLKSKNV
jgi:transposase